MPFRNRLTPNLHSELQIDPSRILDTLVNNLHGMVYRCKQDSNWTMLFVSQGCSSLTGYTPEELIGNAQVSYEELTHPEDRERVRQEIDLAVASNQRFSVHYRIITNIGQIKWVYERGIGVLDESGKLVIEGFIEDETANKKTLEALQNAEHYYRNLVENAAVGIFQTSMEGRYLSANPTLAKIYGYTTTEELTQAMEDIGRQLYVEAKRREEFRQIMRTHGEVVNFESEVTAAMAAKYGFLKTPI